MATNKVNCVTNPGKINGVSAAAIAAVMGVTFSSGFDPLTLTGLQVAYDDQSTITAAGTSRFTAVSDRTGNGNNGAVDDVAGGPERGHKRNALDCLLFFGDISTGVDDDVIKTGWTPTGAFYAVLKIQRGRQREGGSTTIRPFFHMGSGTGANTNFSVGTRDNNDSADSSLYVWDGVTVFSSPADEWQIGDNSTIYIEADLAAGTCTVKKDGVAVTNLNGLTGLATTGMTLSEVFLMGDASHTARRCNGYFQAAYLGDNTLTAQEQTDVDTYLERFDSSNTASLVVDFSGRTQWGTDTGAGQACAHGTFGANGWFFTCGGSTNEQILTFDDDGAAFGAADVEHTYDTSGDNGGAQNIIAGLHADTANDKLYATGTNHPTTPYEQYCLVYDVNPATGALTYDTAFTVAGTEVIEGVSELLGDLWFCFDGTNEIKRYTKAGVAVKTYTLPTIAPQAAAGWNSCFFIGNQVFMIMHGGGDWAPRMDTFYYDSVTDEFLEAMCGMWPDRGNQGGGVISGGTHDGDVIVAFRTSGVATSNNHVDKMTPVTRTIAYG